MDLRVKTLDDDRVEIEPTSLPGMMSLCDGDLPAGVVRMEAATAEFILRRAEEVGLYVKREVK